MQKHMRLQEGWSTLFLVLAMVLVTGLALERTEIIDGLEIIPTLGILAVIAGLFLAKSRFSSNLAHTFSFVFGAFAVFFLLGSMLPVELTWRERIFDLFSRQGAWLIQVMDGSTSRDRMIFVIQTSVIFWLLGYTAAWYTFRYPRVWRVVVPSGLVMLSVVYYYNGPRPLWLFLAVYTLLALLYVARTYLTAQEQEWRRASVRYERSIAFSFLRAGFLVALLGLIIAWGMPTMSASASMNEAFSGTRGPWREFQDNWTRMFSALRSYGTTTTDPYLDTLVLGGPRTVGEGLVMDVIVKEQLPYVYWQAMAYDTYENGLWSVSDSETSLHFPDDGALDTPTTKARQSVEQTVINYLPSSSVLYGAPEVVSSDRQMFVDATENEAGNELVTAVRSRYVLRQGDQYEVVSKMSTADASALRETSLNYPDWVTETYLQTPDAITPETVALAEEITAAYDNPFDKSIALRDYLRNNITYNDQIDAPPNDVDPVHYILFDLQEGYCTYYASSMVMMMRSQGIPSRFVSGYAQGAFDEESSSYRVRAHNAHTWVEAYFPDYGWIQFEPTASIPTVSRPEDDGAGGDAFDQAGGLPTDEERLEDVLDVDLGEDGLLDESVDLSGLNNDSFLNDFPIWTAVGAIVVFLLAGAAVYAANQANIKVEKDVEKSYSRLGGWSGWLGLFFRPADTPHERADMLTAVVPEGKAPIRNLTQQYTIKQFSPRKDEASQFDSSKEWKTLRPLLVRRSIVVQAQKIRQIFTRRPKA